MPDTETVTRVNLGSGELPLDGWVNVDAYTPADVIGDMRNLDFGDLDAVNMSHSLEHVAWVDVPALLGRIHDWLRPGGTLLVEVPDMGAIMAAPSHLWEVYVYGAQVHEGEFHRSGYTQESLAAHLKNAGFSWIKVDRFVSTHPWRPGMPCLKATAVV